MIITIKTEIRSVQQMLDSLPIEIQRKVVPMAINREAQVARTEMKRQIASEFNLSSGEINSGLRIIRASEKLGRFGVILDPFASRRRGRSMNLIHFLEKRVSLAEARRRRKSGTISQLRFRIKKVGGQKMIPGAFIANAGRTIFQRVGKSRLPIEPIQTINLAAMFNTQRINQAVIDRIHRDLPIQMQRAINTVLR